MNITISFLTGFFLFFSLSDSAYAYVDPGSITVILQVAIASIAGVFFYFKDFFIGLFSKKKSTERKKEKEK